MSIKFLVRNTSFRQSCGLARGIVLRPARFGSGHEVWLSEDELQSPIVQARLARGRVQVVREERPSAASLAPAVEAVPEEPPPVVPETASEPGAADDVEQTPPSDESATPASRLRTLKKEVLVAMCLERGLDSTGTRPALIDRLLEVL